MTNGRESKGLTRCSLRNRDRRLLSDLFLHRVVSRDQIIALGHFGSVPRCNNRLKHLLDHGYVRRYRHLARGSGSQALYCLGCNGAAIVSELLDLELEEVKLQAERCAPSMFLEHSLGLVDLRILFGQTASRLQVPAHDWLAEPLCRHEYSVWRAGAWIKCVVKPDAFALWTWNGEPRAFFIELDLGHVSQQSFQRKIQAYRRYLADGAFREAYGHESFEVLTVTTSERRLGNLAMLAGTGEGPRFLYTTLSALQAEGIGGRIWADGRKIVSLFGGGE